MTRSRTIARILALLRHAEADTAEGRSAARLAAKLQQRHRVTEADVQTARLATDDRQRVPLTFTEPWEVALAVIVAGGFGVRCMADPTAPAVLVGLGAARAARHLEIIRIRVESRLAAAGGATGVARAAREQAAARRAPPSPPSQPLPPSPTGEPASASEPSPEADGQEREKAAPETAADEEAAQRAEAMRQQVQELIARALRVANARPAWIVDAPESGALAVM